MADHPTVITVVRSVITIMLFIFLGIVQPLSSYDGELIYRQAVVLTVTRPLVQGESPKHREVISNAMRFFLENQGLEVINSPILERVPVTEENTEPGNMVALNHNDLLIMARSVPADFLIVAMYSVADEEIQLVFTLYDILEGNRCATASRKTMIDFTFDQIVSDVVDELLLSIKHKLARYSPAQQALPLEAAHPAVDSSPEPAAVLPDPQSEVPKRIEIAAGIAPFLPIGKTSDYFKIGLCTAVHGSYRFNVGSLQLSVGLLTGTYMFKAEGLSGSADTFLLSIGPLIGIIYGYGSPIDLFARFSGGAVLMSIAPSGLDQRLSKFLPYAIGTVGLSLGFSPNLGLIAETNLVAFFETADGSLSPLLGFTPAVYLYVHI